MPEQSQAEVLLVDGDPVVGREIVSSLSRRNYGVEWVDDDEKAYNCLESQAFDVLVTELNMQRVDGMRVMGAALDRNPDICVIMITEYPDIELATEAMRQGAYDYQTKPLNVDKLEAVIERGLGYQRLLYDQFQLRRRIEERFGVENLVGKSRSMVRAYSRIRQAAPSTVPIIVVGEPGTGKDHVAQAIHNNSVRRTGAFVKLGCGADNRGLVRRDLLGHEADVFPGTTEARQGRLELADRGTLYLDNVSEFPQLVFEQVLACLASGKVQRVGETKFSDVDIRLVVSVVPNLKSDDKTGAFLSSLQSDFDALIIELPPLRERIEDIPILVDHFIRSVSMDAGRKVAGVTRHAMDVLTRYDWPDNVRQLQNTVEGMVLAGRDDKPLDLRDVPASIRQAASSTANEMRIPAGSSMSDVERIVIEETMLACGYNKELCAKTLGIGLRTLYRKLKEYDIH